MTRGRSGRPSRIRRGHSVSRYKLGDDPRSRRLHRTWYRGKTCNFIPSKVNLAEKDALAKYVAHGWAPTEPLIEADASILAVGSCFAQYIVQQLRRTRREMRINDGMNVNVIAFGAGFVNTFTLLQQFEWALGMREIESNTLYVEQGEGVGVTKHMPDVRLMPLDDDVRQRTRKVIEDADAFILTLGLSEVWYERESGDVFFGAVPAEVFDDDKHAFRVTTVEENLSNLVKLRNLLRLFKPRAPIVFTLSPVPLTATFRPVSCLTASNVSKSILRVAVDELVRNTNDELLFYWPSYEIVTEVYGPAAYQDDRRHVRHEVVGDIMQLFERYFVKEK